jgi:hypothetical protein
MFSVLLATDRVTDPFHNFDLRRTLSKQAVNYVLSKAIVLMMNEQYYPLVGQLLGCCLRRQLHICLIGRYGPLGQ